MIETVFALILTLNGSMIEHTYKTSLSECLKSKRLAQNEVNPERVVFTCKKVKAQTEIYMDRKKIIPNKKRYVRRKKLETESFRD
jgi:hypothetical protein